VSGGHHVGMTDNQRYELVIWCHDCRQGHHQPALCPSGGLEERHGPFASVEDARSWVDKAAIDKRAPLGVRHSGPGDR
jgi:hypothetical protein